MNEYLDKKSAETFSMKCIRNVTFLFYFFNLYVEMSSFTYVLISLEEVITCKTN